MHSALPLSVEEKEGILEQMRVLARGMRIVIAFPASLLDASADTINLKAVPRLRRSTRGNIVQSKEGRGGGWGVSQPEILPSRAVRFTGQ